MTKAPGHRNPRQTRAMIVKDVAVRFWFPLTGEIEGMCIKHMTVPMHAKYSDSLALCDARLTLRNAQLS